MTGTHRARRLWSAAVAATAALLVSAGVQVCLTGAAHASSSVGGTISRSEVVERAEYWVRHNVPYNQDATYPDPEGKAYRTDCSGLVSMAWHLDTTGTYLGGYNTDAFGSWSGKTVLGSWNDLKQGDAALGVSYGHIVLFVSWTSSAHTTMNVIEEAHPGTNARYSTYSVSWLNANGFEPIRYKNVIDDGPDQVAWVTAVGGLQFHPPAGPYAGGTMVDTTPTSDEYLIAGDWDGDGRDTVAWVTKQAGGLQFHPLDGPNKGGLMVDTTPTSDEYLIAGDWDGDGKDTVAWVTREAGGLQFHPVDGPNKGGLMVDTTPTSDEYLIAGDWDGDGKDTVAWVTREAGGLQFHPVDGPNKGGLMVDTTPTSDEYLIAGDWDGDGKDTIAWVTRQAGGLQFHPVDGPNKGGLMIDTTPTSDEYLIAGDWA